MRVGRVWDTAAGKTLWGVVITPADPYSKSLYDEFCGASANMTGTSANAVLLDTEEVAKQDNDVSVSDDGTVINVYSDFVKTSQERTEITDEGLVLDRLAIDKFPFIRNTLSFSERVAFAKNLLNNGFVFVKPDDTTSEAAVINTSDKVKSLKDEIELASKDHARRVVSYNQDKEKWLREKRKIIARAKERANIKDYDGCNDIAKLSMVLQYIRNPHLEASKPT